MLMKNWGQDRDLHAFNSIQSKTKKGGLEQCNVARQRIYKLIKTFPFSVLLTAFSPHFSLFYDFKNRKIFLTTFIVTFQHDFQSVPLVISNTCAFSTHWFIQYLHSQSTSSQFQQRTQSMFLHRSHQRHFRWKSIRYRKTEENGNMHYKSTLSLAQYIQNNLEK